MDPTDPQPASAPSREPSTGPLEGLDRWVASSPWHPRLLPYLLYLLILAPAGAAGERLPELLPAFSALQLVLVGFLLWRYRRLTPEMNLRFHWSAIVTGVALLPAWIYAGWASNALGGMFDPDIPTHPIEGMLADNPAVGWLAMSARFCTMVLLVPLFEELFIRSGCVRGFHSAKRTWLGVVQLASDLPGIGEKIANGKLGREANQLPGQITQQLEDVPLGRVTVFATAASTLIFMLAHHPRDWLGCIICGVVWCAMVWWLNPADRIRKQDVDEAKTPRTNYGLGPVIWSHAIINALLWGYTLYSGNWEFL